MDTRHFDVIVIGCSAGGFEALRTILQPLPKDFPVPIVVVSHVAPDFGELLAELLGRRCAMAVCEAEDKSPLLPRTIHVAPAGYHLLLEADRTFSLSVDAKVCGVRPSVDVLFESAADGFGGGVIGIVLTGANDDGAHGLRMIHDAGGLGLVQDPAEAKSPEMPLAAIAAGGADFVVPLGEISSRLLELITADRAKAGGGRRRDRAAE